jgi:hypothetical protein
LLLSGAVFTITGLRVVIIIVIISNCIIRRYDRNYAPNVSLAAEPFDELRKLRPDDESDDCDVIETATAVNCMSGVPPSAFPRRRSTHSSSDVYYSPDDDDDDEDYDTESVSSDKRRFFYYFVENSECVCHLTVTETHRVQSRSLPLESRVVLVKISDILSRYFVE